MEIFIFCGDKVEVVIQIQLYTFANVVLFEDEGWVQRKSVGKFSLRLLPAPSSAQGLLAHLPWRAAPGKRRRGRRLELAPTVLRYTHEGYLSLQSRFSRICRVVIDGYIRANGIARHGRLCLTYNANIHKLFAHFDGLALIGFSV